MNTVQDTVANLKGIPTRDELIKLLQKEIVEVTFTKLNGDERIMPCTLVESFFPDPKKEATQKAKTSYRSPNNTTMSGLLFFKKPE